MRLSKYFQLSELLTTRHTHLADEQLAYARDPKIRAALEALCTTILDPIREHVGGPVRINSGVRCPELRLLIPGASPTSQHNYGGAGDLQVPAWSTTAELRELWRWIGWHSGLPFGQVILEDADPSDPDDEGAWIHVSLGAPWRSASRCGQRWTWTPAEGYVRIYTEPRA